MRTKLITLSALMLAVSAANAATYLNNLHTIFNPAAPHSVNQIKNTADGGYIIIGTVFVNSVPQPGSRPLAIKLNPNFTLQWKMTYYQPGDFSSGFLGGVFAEDIDQTPDGGYIVCGRHIEEFNMDGSFLMRLDPAGNVIWYQTYSAIHDLSSVIQMDRGDGLDGYMACGHSYFGGLATPTILRVDAGGSVEWVRYVWSILGRDQWHGVYNQIIPYFDGPAGPVAALVGNTNQHLTGCSQHSDVLVTMVDTFGNIPFDRVYGQGDIFDGNGGQWSSFETGNSIARDPVTNELVIAGNSTAYNMTECAPTSFDDLFAFKIDPAGTVLWANHYDVQGNGHQDMGSHVVISNRPDRRPLITGWSNTNLLSSAHSHDVVLVQLTTAAGGVLSGEVFGGGGLDEARSLVENSALNPVMLANSTSFLSGQQAIYVIERLANTLRRCLDRGVTISRTPVPLPTDVPFDAFGNTPAMPVPVHAVPPFINQSVLCSKVEAFISLDPIGGVSPATVQRADHP